MKVNIITNDQQIIVQNDVRIIECDKTHLVLTVGDVAEKVSMPLYLVKSFGVIQS